MPEVFGRARGFLCLFNRLSALKIVEILWKGLWRTMWGKCAKVTNFLWKTIFVENHSEKLRVLHRVVEKFSRSFSQGSTSVIKEFFTVSTGLTTATTIFIKEDYGD